MLLIISKLNQVFGGTSILNHSPSSSMINILFSSLLSVYIAGRLAFDGR